MEGNGDLEEGEETQMSGDDEQNRRGIVGAPHEVQQGRPDFALVPAEAVEDPNLLGPPEKEEEVVG